MDLFYIFISSKLKAYWSELVQLRWTSGLQMRLYSTWSGKFATPHL